MNNTKSARRYIEAHNSVCLEEDNIKRDEVKSNLQEQQIALFEHLKDCMENRMPVTHTAVTDLYYAMRDVMDGYYPKLLMPLDVKQGRAKEHMIITSAIGVAVSYVALCKAGTLKDKSFNKSIREAYRVDASTVRDWYKDERYKKFRDTPHPFPSLETAQRCLEEMGGIYARSPRSFSNSANQKKP